MRIALFTLAIAVLIVGIIFSPALAAKYYAEQTDFTETSIPVEKYSWGNSIDGCIYKEDGVKNSYYLWTKLAVQKWRQALREYTGNQEAWSFSVHYVRSEAALETCDVKFYIYDSYRDFPEYPAQTGAYTYVDKSGPDARVYLAPVVLHGDGKTEINLPNYAFRNSAVHEVGHVLGLAHMQSQMNYLMSPQFDFWKEKDQLPITTLELDAVVGAYGTNGFD